MSEQERAELHDLAEASRLVKRYSTLFRLFLGALVAVVAWQTSTAFRLNSLYATAAEHKLRLDKIEREGTELSRADHARITKIEKQLDSIDTKLSDLLKAISRLEGETNPRSRSVQ